MVQCNSCDTEAYGADLFCRGCGEELAHEEDTITCDCNAVVENDDNYCHSCGAEFEGADDDGDDDDGDDGGEEPDEEY